jgi:hypothetical protein
LGEGQVDVDFGRQSRGGLHGCLAPAPPSCGRNQLARRLLDALECRL